MISNNHFQQVADAADGPVPQIQCEIAQLGALAH